MMKRNSSRLDKIYIIVLLAGIAIGTIITQLYSSNIYKKNIDVYEEELNVLKEDIDKKNDLIDSLTANISKIDGEVNSLNLLLNNYKNNIDELSRVRYYGNISISEARKLIEINTNMFILDVRTTLEFEDGHIEGALNIPLDDLRNRIVELDKEEEILIYCWKGGRSYSAFNILLDEGFIGLYNMREGFEAWLDGGFPVEEGCGC
jgi:rhodanese-related sulfurtransferase